MIMRQVGAVLLVSAVLVLGDVSSVFSSCSCPDAAFFVVFPSASGGYKCIRYPPSYILRIHLIPLNTPTFLSLW